MNDQPDPKNTDPPEANQQQSDNTTPGRKRKNPSSPSSSILLRIKRASRWAVSAGVILSTSLITSYLTWSFRDNYDAALVTAEIVSIEREPRSLAPLSLYEHPDLMFLAKYTALMPAIRAAHMQQPLNYQPQFISIPQEYTQHGQAFFQPHILGGITSHNPFGTPITITASEIAHSQFMTNYYYSILPQSDVDLLLRHAKLEKEHSAEVLASLRSFVTSTEDATAIRVETAMSPIFALAGIGVPQGFSPAANASLNSIAETMQRMATDVNVIAHTVAGAGSADAMNRDSQTGPDRDNQHKDRAPRTPETQDTTTLTPTPITDGDLPRDGRQIESTGVQLLDWNKKIKEAAVKRAKDEIQRIESLPASISKAESALASIQRNREDQDSRFIISSVVTNTGNTDTALREPVILRIHIGSTDYVDLECTIDSYADVAGLSKNSTRVIKIKSAFTSSAPEPDRIGVNKHWGTSASALLLAEDITGQRVQSLPVLFSEGAQRKQTYERLKRGTITR